MTNLKTTKRALLSSVVALLVCFTMLLGTTFAWFTDSVTSANNIIQTGTLDVEMYWAKGTEDPSSADWKDASQGAIFNSELWEPGYVEARHIKIANVGTLALKYKLAIAPNGEVSELADVIDVYFVDPAQIATRDSLAALTPVGTLRQMIDDPDGAAYGSLLAEDESTEEIESVKTVTIALKMREDAGNEYQNLSIGTNFSIVLMATQDNVEKDAFDENYDDIEIPDMDVQVIDGNTYHYTIDGNVVLASVPYGNVDASFTVPDDVTILGQGDVYDGAVPVFSKSSPIESITLPEGLVEIKARAITGVKTLTSINFPSTLKAIRAQALRQTGMDELTVPANVEVIGEGAFRDMANLTTVTVNGNVAFDNNAFRSCPNLTSIYLLGDDVTFSGGQFATHTDAGDATGITIYVKNATVAARVYAAQTSAYGYEVKILGAAADGSDAAEVEKAANSTQLDAAIQAGTTTVVLGNGNYIIPDSAQGKTLTIVGNGNTVVATQDDGSYEGCDYSLDGSTVTFEGVTITTDSRTYTGYAHCSATYNNCTINGAYTLYGESVFNNCTFNVTGDTYNIWTWGAKKVEFNGCTFNTDGKSILVYNQSCDVYVNNCTFNDRTNGTGFTKSALETGVDGVGPKYNIYITNSTFNGFAENDKCVGYKTIVGNKNSMTNEYLNIVVDGVDVY